ncbi:hypothetical protein [Minwuia thermotolerans]|uniref:hypothetical protein n=1 Tax=Minwuia thermotolerans TaxID=2056226 RepID=UPI000F62C300|nr:hypothetical protein [Minwuia thermotolerans]
MAETRRTDALYGFEAEDALDGGDAQDTPLDEDEPETAEPAAEVEDAARPEAAAHGDAASPAQGGEASDEVEAAAVPRVTGDPDLDRVHRMLRSTPFARAAEDPDRLSEITAQEERIVGSFTTVQIEDRLRRLTLHTRRWNRKFVWDSKERDIPAKLSTPLWKG